jgi:2-methylcitrate dehydratase PrpD
VNPTVTTQVASWAGDLRFGQVPERVREWLGLRVADHLGLIAGARSSQPGRAVLEVCRRVPGDVPLLFEETGVTASMAALAHGTLAHVFDYDDTYPDSVIHPSSVVIPAALAAGAKADGPEVMTAMLVGYEFLARCGTAVGRRLHARGFHATAVLGPLAAALVACKAMGAGQEVTVKAMGLAGSMSGGLLEFLADGSWSKRMHPGWAAHGGLLAAELAAAGFTGPASIVEGRNGIFRAFLDDPQPSLAYQFTDLGSRWSCLGLQWKRYPCAHVIHPYLDLALLLRARHLEAAQIQSVCCDVAPWCVPIVLEPMREKRAPENEYQARASLPYALAAALTDGSVGPAAFEDYALQRADVLRLAAAVDYREDESLSTSFQARLAIRLSSGELLEADAASLPPHGDGLSMLRDKFDANIGAVVPGFGSGDLWHAATALADTGPAELARLCSAALRR